MAFAGKTALTILDRIGNDNRKGEFYLTDAVAIAREMKLRGGRVETEEDEVRGINTKAQLAETEAVLQQRLRKAALEAGVTMVAPETVFLSADTKFGRDVVIEPYVVFGPGVTVEDSAVIHSFSHLDRRACRQGRARSAPMRGCGRARISASRSHIGNFVEIKEARDRGRRQGQPSAPISATPGVGAGANFGAGTIICNYDGVAKHRTDIGKGAFIGSNSALVAPVTIGDGAYVATGSVVTQNVPPDALVIARSRQVVKENRASRLREMKSAGKKKAAE